ncbi:MAG TPA: ABC transporter substrate-binding protein [Caldimonas sp.]|jgi:ABC-type transport system substrate-binding protein|nr:ABC transporter substrate-binding protein [Caldimonas sp.]HEX4232679.1 ABC transporter substrate-binding protein [Caldimonas sp.]
MSGIDRRSFALGGAGLIASARALTAPVENAETAVDANVLRILFEGAETGFDPAQVSDLYSNRVNAHIFEALLDYDPLAVPVRLVPQTAEAMPEASADFTVWTVRLQRGILFADDPAFKGRPRELVAADYVYAFKRIYDPALKSPAYSALNEDGILGLEEVRVRALRDKKPFDYDAFVDGVRALDRHTLQFKLAKPRPRFPTTLASTTYAAIAREVTEAYGADVMAHPVGTGPYRLKLWRRSSRIVLDKNPSYREVRYQSDPAADDGEAVAWAKRLNGKRLPLNDGVEIAVVEENQPRWLSFLNGQADFARVPPELSPLSAPNGKLAPNLAKQGIRLQRYLNPDVALSYFNMDDPVVGGYTAAKVALRRAVHLAYDIDYEIRIIRRGQAIAAQAPLAPGTYGFDPTLRTENSRYDVARAKALLDLYGYVDRNGDGWREQPDGSPLVLTMASEPEQIYRQYNENWQRSMTSIGIRMIFETAHWPEHMKAARAGKLQMWFLGSTAADPDGQSALEYMYGESIGQSNLARFKLPAFDAIYRRMLDLPDGAERLGLFRKAEALIVAYMPYRIHVHRIYNDFSRPWITGYRQPFFRNASWHFIEVDGAMRAKALA